jgi:hypothetical protein
MSDDEEGEVPAGVAVFPLIPPELGIDPVLLAVLHAVVFIAGSGANIIDQDAADEALEYLAAYLQRLDGPRLMRIREDMQTLVGFAKEEKWSKEEIRSLKDFLSDFGVAGDD